MTPVWRVRLLMLLVAGLILLRPGFGEAGQAETAPGAESRTCAQKHRVCCAQLSVLEQQPRVFAIRSRIARYIANPPLERVLHAVGVAKRSQRPDLRRAQRRLAWSGGDRSLEDRQQ